MGTIGLYLAGGEDESIAHQVCFIHEHLRQLLAHVSGQLPQPQQVVVDGHPCYGLGSREQRIGNETWAPTCLLPSSLVHRATCDSNGHGYTVLAVDSVCGWQAWGDCFTMWLLLLEPLGTFMFPG